MTSPRINLATSAANETFANRWPTGFLQPRIALRCEADGTVTATAGTSVFKRWSEPLEALDWMSTQFPFKGGRWVGHLSYDLGRWFERLPAPPRDDLNVPLFHFHYCVPLLDRSNFAEPRHPTSDAPLRGHFSRPAYEAAVQRAIDYIAAGDVFQVNLSQRFTVGVPDQPADVYYRLSRETPALFGGLLNYDDYAIISNSPELLLRVTAGRHVTTRPIKGTRPATDGMEEALRDSAKDAAELNMIVDLERNDLGRVCEIGSVRVTEPRRIERHPTVLHGVATIEGQLRNDVSFVQLLRATFPGGSVTGAPKVRAMEIIDELEPVRRGPYCGAIGYLNADGSMEFNVAIRTMVLKDGLAHVSVGGGIVADSNPAEEYDETIVKAKAMFAALGVGDASMLVI
ncbi:MAG TPA: anthranilate synthase component I family protein [Tepidisphaeraceae bacterium]|jgi:para-aminobenzoate synthetase component 1|nr:anthranilate synthase component I family protein [Tepidisphaeraceae bacterium]